MNDPRWLSWFSGLVDGEGCFLIGRVQVPYYEVKFVINMRADDRPMLEEIKNTLGFGRLAYRQRGKIGHPTVAFEVSKATDLLKLVRLFDEYPLRSRKRRDYEVWRVAVLLRQTRKNARDVHVEELLRELRTTREFRLEVS